MENSKLFYKVLYEVIHYLKLLLDYDKTIFKPFILQKVVFRLSC